MKGVVYFSDNLPILKKLNDNSAQLIYIDPPFNTGKKQIKNTVKVSKSSSGNRTGFKGAVYNTQVISTHSYNDKFDDFWGFLLPRLVEAKRILKETGTLYLHLDYREVHYARVELDKLFGRENFLNEIIWAYDYGGKSKKRWPAKHDNILVYVKNPKLYYFNSERVDREPYMAPGLVGPEKAKLKKLPTDTWWNTIVSATGKEKTGYPTQKPAKILKRIISASSDTGDTVLDFFAGSGTTGQASIDLDRDFILIDDNPEAIDIMKHRFEGQNVRFI
jgi:site-specific DNA-methyltransferase (adenine-specific)